VQHGLDLGGLHLELRGQPLADVLHGDAEVAVVVDGVDDRQRDGGVGLAEGREVELPEQVIAQGLGRRAAQLRGLAILAVAAARGQPRVVVDVLPAAVDGELVRDGLGGGRRGLGLAQPLGAGIGLLLGRGVRPLGAGRRLGLRLGLVLALLDGLQHRVRLQRLLDLELQLHGG